ncbi:CIC11C00000001213 [Sungouiella intermedia]|uniref:CIC11C00000001213 n=1 Tax=Sungouiella intermedia TaxID=45354 RepID=A0A1L0C5H3_9ASCO|nr:CIC11C00000001213 [[Candida] intermedia]
MSPRDLTSSSVSSFSADHYPLFPRMGNARRPLNVQPPRTSRRLMDSTEHLGHIFKGDFGIKQRLEDSNLSAKGSCSQESSSRVGPCDTQASGIRYDEDSELDLADWRTVSTDGDQSFDSSILRNIGNRMGPADTAPADKQNDKFKYLSLYESMAGKNPNGSNHSVFNLSGLDDFTRFMRKSELNDAIQKHAQETLVREDNLLPVMENDMLGQNFTTDYNSEAAGGTHKESHKSKRPWQNKSIDKDKYATKSDINELRLAGDTLGSSDSSTRDSIFLSRKLKVRHLQMISFGGTLGVGLYLNSGKAFTIAGGFGTVLAFAIVGIIVLATIVSFCEMVTFVSVVDGVSGLSARFVDDSFGFATGWLYFISFSVGLAGEIVASVIILSYFQQSKILENQGATVGFVSLFWTFCLVSNLIDVRVFGEIEYFSSLIKVIMTLIMIVVMIVINRGGLGKMGAIGFKYWTYSKSDFDHNVIFGLFRPTFDLRSNGMDSELHGIPGNLGRFLSVLSAVLIVSYAYSGTEIVCIAACEAKDPRKALPSATKRVFWRILIFYCLASFVVSLNIYAGDPRLLRYYTGNSGVSPDTYDTNYAIHYVGGNNCHSATRVYAGFANGSQSPWAVAFQSVGLCDWSSVANAFLVFFALSCGNSQLYVSSRTIYSLSLQNKAPAFLKKCNRFGIPYYSVLVASAPALSSFICVSELATVVFQNLTSIISSSGVFVWFAMCLSYIRFFYGLKKRPDIMSREDKSYPYRSPFQPYSAIVGLTGSSVILLGMGYVVFMKDHWDTMFFFSSYGSLILFAALYLGYKVTKGTRILSLEALDFDSGRREMDIYIWDGGKEYNTRNIKHLAYKMVDFLA